MKKIKITIEAVCHDKPSVKWLELHMDSVKYEDGREIGFLEDQPECLAIGKITKVEVELLPELPDQGPAT